VDQFRKRRQVFSYMEENIVAHVQANARFEVFTTVKIQAE